MNKPAELISTNNRFGVAVGGGETVILLPPRHMKMTTTEALQLAAWLVAVNIEHEEEFQDLLKRVMDT